MVCDKVWNEDIMGIVPWQNNLGLLNAKVG